MSAESGLLIAALLGFIFMGLTFRLSGLLEKLKAKHDKLCDLTSNFVVDPDQAIKMGAIEVLDNLEQYFVTVLPCTKVGSPFNGEVLDIIYELRKEYGDQ